MTEEKLIRGIGRWDLTAVVINCIVGAGIFGLPSKVYAAIGVYSLVAFVVCAVIVALIVICHAEVASRFAATGGAYLYAKEAFGPTAAFEVGWLYWIVRMATFAANCNLLVTYLGFFWPMAADPVVRIILILLVVILLTAVNIAGVRQSVHLTNFFTIGKLLPLFVFALVGLFFIQPASFELGPAPGYTSFTSAVLLLIYAFVGFEVAVIPAGEMKEPQRIVPFALFAGLAIVVTAYILIQVVSIGTLPGLASSERPIADAAANFMGPIGASMIVIGALVSIMGNLNVGLIGGSRIVFAMGEHREMPGILAKTHEKFRTPYVAILLNAVIILVLTIQSSFLSALAIATITRLVIYATTCLAMIVFRNREDAPPAKYIAPFGIAAAAVSIALVIWLLTNVDFTKEGLPIIAAAVAGLVLYYLFRAFRKSPAE
jgi:amino acid transporter